MSFDTLTKKEIMILLKKVQDIATMLKDINEIINSEDKDPSDPEDNVIQIIPNVIQQFSKNQKVPMNIVNIVTLYENWTQDLYTATIDEVISNIRSTFEYSKNTLPTASQNTVRGISMLLVVNLRRAWFDRQIALEVLARG